MDPWGVPDPPEALLTAEDIAEFRRWAYTTLGAGRGEDVLDVLAAHNETRPPTATFDELEAELYVRIGIATDQPQYVGLATQWLLEPAYEGPPPRVAFIVAVGAGWLVGQCDRRERFRSTGRLLMSARRGLREALSSGELLPAETQEAAAALEETYAAAWRTNDPARQVTLPRDASPDLSSLSLELRAARRSSEPGAQAFAAWHALRELSRWCEPRWPAIGGPWWISCGLGLTIDIAEPTSERERHRFALADVYLEAEYLLDEIDVLEEGTGERDVAVERRVLDLADQAVAHVARGQLATRQRGVSLPLDG